MLTTAVWPAAMELLKPRMTDASYENWIKPLEPKRIEDGALVLVAPTAIHRDTLSRFYGTLVNECLCAAAGEAASVRFVTLEEENDREAKEKEKPRASCPSLIPKYTFDTFVRGESNSFAYAAALAVAENPSQAYNPLFIYGGVGLGKTHLMHAIGHYIQNEHPSYEILYTTSENFTNDLVQSIEKKDRAALHEKYRSLDVLLIDDIQFIGGREATELEFFNVFNVLHSAGKQIIITSDKPPKDVPVLEERLRSRFGWGLPVDMKPPDYETRLAILRRKATEDGIVITDDVLALIAERVNSNIRELEGCLNRAVAYAKLINKPLTPTVVEGILTDYLSGSETRSISGELIKRIVGDFFGVTPAELESSRRDRKYAYPRQIAMYLTRSLIDCSYQEIGMTYGGRHYSTVMHACEQIDGQLPTDAELKKTVEDLISRIKNG